MRPAGAAEYAERNGAAGGEEHQAVPFPGSEYPEYGREEAEEGDARRSGDQSGQQGADEGRPAVAPLAVHFGFDAVHGAHPALRLQQKDGIFPDLRLVAAQIFFYVGVSFHCKRVLSRLRAENSRYFTVPAGVWRIAAISRMLHSSK